MENRQWFFGSVIVRVHRSFRSTNKLIFWDTTLPEKVQHHSCPFKLPVVAVVSSSPFRLPFASAYHYVHERTALLSVFNIYTRHRRGKLDYKSIDSLWQVDWKTYLCKPSLSLLTTVNTPRDT